MEKQPPVKLLIVDDESFIVDELCDFFTDHGYSCTGCHSAEEALALFQRDPQIGIVLSDLHMPGLDGLGLIKELELRHRQERRFEAIIFTGLTESRGVIDAMRAGVADYYQKPVVMDDVLRGVKRLERHLQERRKDSLRLDQLNQKLQYLAESIGELNQDIHAMRGHFGQPSLEQCVESAIPAPFNQLSPRQLEVARLIGKGQTNYQISCELGITENTVKLYVSQVLRLTHMHNRTQLALALAPSRPQHDAAATTH